MKRFYLISDSRFPEEIYYGYYKGFVRKNQKKKWLWLTIRTVSKEGKLKYINRFQLVKIKDNKVVL